MENAVRCQFYVGLMCPHHPEATANAGWIIDLGLGAGYDSGRVAFEGTPVDFSVTRSTLTGRYLAAYVGLWPEALADT